jgi:DnaK suppressor protein
MSKTNEPDLKVARQRLINLKRELEEISQIAKESRAIVKLDQQSVGRLSRIDAMQQQAMSLATEHRRKNDLIRIELAFQRVRDDEYGYCADCGEVIADKRLEIDPMAERCINCAK